MLKGVKQLNECYGNGNCYRTLYSNKDCTHKIGYQYIDFVRDMIDRENIIFIINKTFFIQKDIFRIGYVKINNEAITSPIIKYNNWTNTNNEIGSIERIILPDEIIRQLVITVNE